MWDPPPWGGVPTLPTLPKTGKGQPCLPNWALLHFAFALDSMGMCNSSSQAPLRRAPSCVAFGHLLHAALPKFALITSHCRIPPLVVPTSFHPGTLVFSWRLLACLEVLFLFQRS